MIYRIKYAARKFAQNRKFAGLAYRWANSAKTRIMAGMSDEQFARWRYYENTGMRLNLQRPTGFNEKLWWLKLYNRDPLMSTCSDKYLVRDYIRSIGLSHMLVPVVAVYDRPEDVVWQDLPDAAFLKTNNGSGTNVRWRRDAPFDREDFEDRFRAALSQDYYVQSREWNYKGIVPKIVVEQELSNPDGAPLIDYRFYCFDGQVRLIIVAIDTVTADGSHDPRGRRNVYTREFELLPVRLKRRQNFPYNFVSRPENLSEMIKTAERIARPFTFCRVDLYNIDGQILFGETTFYPSGGAQLFDPIEWEYYAGSLLDLSSDSIVSRLDKDP